MMNLHSLAKGISDIHWVLPKHCNSRFSSVTFQGPYKNSDNYFRTRVEQGGPLLVINGVITPINGLIIG